MKPSSAMKHLDFSKLPKEVRDKMKADLSEVSDDTLDLQFEQSTFKRWVETFADLYPAAFGIKEEKAKIEEKEPTPASKSEPKSDVKPKTVEPKEGNKPEELASKIKELETRAGVVTKMIAKQPTKRAELKVRLKTIQKMISKFKDDLKKEKGSKTKMGDGGSIGFIPMELENDLSIISKRGGLDSISDVIGILNAMIDSELTDEDLITPKTKTGSQYEKQRDLKTKEIWSKIESNYNGNLKGNQYYSAVNLMVYNKNSMNENLLEKFKPYRKNQKFNNGGSMSSESPRVYIADLAAYNEGKLIGEWIDLSDYGSSEEVMDKIKELLNKWSKEQGVEREEYAVHDAENLPEGIYSEYMGSDSFQKVIDYWEAVNNSDFPVEVVKEYMSLLGENDFSDSVDKMNDSYYGTFDSESDFANEYVESVGGMEGVSNPERYLEVSDTDKRIVANEQADADIENMDDDDILERTEMKDEYDEAENNDDSDEMESILDKAKEKLHDEIYDEWFDGLDDPYDFLVNQHGIYDADSLLKANFIMFDYDKLARELSWDFELIEHDGKLYVFHKN